MAPLQQLILLIITLSETASADPNSTVTGLLGGSVSIHCPYRTSGDRWREKIWCREVSTNYCKQIVRTSWTSNFFLSYVRSNSSNTSITANDQEHQATVTMKWLQLKDSGVYQCQTKVRGHSRTLRKVNLEVVEEMPTAEESRTEDKSHSSLVVMTDGMLITLIAGILLSKVLVSFGIYAMVRRCTRGGRERGDVQ